jgi:hypothetical protein
MTVAEPAASIELAMERPLYAPASRPVIADVALPIGADDLDVSAMYEQVIVDKARLARHIRQALQARPRISLRELIDEQPLEQGLAELLAYLQLGRESFKVEVGEEAKELIAWEAMGRDGILSRRHARLPSVVFVR